MGIPGPFQNTCQLAFLFPWPQTTPVTPDSHLTNVHKVSQGPSGRVREWSIRQAMGQTPKHEMSNRLHVSWTVTCYYTRSHCTHGERCPTKIPLLCPNLKIKDLQEKKKKKNFRFCWSHPFGWKTLRLWLLGNIWNLQSWAGHIFTSCAYVSTNAFLWYHSQF